MPSVGLNERMDGRLSFINLLFYFLHSHIVLLRTRTSKRSMTAFRVAVALALLVAFFTVPSLSWGTDGHKIVACIAQNLLTPRVCLSDISGPSSRSQPTLSSRVNQFFRALNLRCFILNVLRDPITRLVGAGSTVVPATSPLF